MRAKTDCSDGVKGSFVGSGFLSVFICCVLSTAATLAQSPIDSPKTDGDTNSASAVPALPPVLPPLLRHEVSVAGDFLYGLGNVTLPFFHSLSRNPNFGTNLSPQVISPDRESI